MQTFALRCVSVSFQHCANTVAKCIDKSSWNEKCFFNKSSTNKNKNKTWTMFVCFILSFIIKTFFNFLNQIWKYWHAIIGIMCLVFRYVHFDPFAQVCVCMRRMLVQRIGLTSTPPTHLYVDLFFQSKSTESFSLSLSDALQTNDNKIEFSHMINSQQICDAHVYNVSMKRMLHH